MNNTAYNYDKIYNQHLFSLPFVFYTHTHAYHTKSLLPRAQLYYIHNVESIIGL